MPRSIFDGTLHALYQTPPWQRLQNAVNARNDESGIVVHEFLVSRMSAQLKGKNGSKWHQARLKREAEQAKAKASSE